MKLGKILIKGTDWDEIVFPKPKSPADLEWDKYVEKRENYVFERADLIGMICESVFKEFDEKQAAKKAAAKLTDIIGIAQ